MVSAYKNSDVAIASLPVLDFGKLSFGNDVEITRLVETCKSLGFFYLKLNGDCQSPLENSRNAFQIMGEYFDQLIDIRMRDIRESDTHG